MLLSLKAPNSKIIHVNPSQVSVITQEEDAHGVKTVLISMTGGKVLTALDPDRSIVKQISEAQGK
jgi:hypothetical protein